MDLSFHYYPSFSHFNHLPLRART